MKYHLILPMAGAGSRFKKLGFMEPKPLLKLHDHPFFAWAALSALQSGRPASITAIVLAEHIAEFQIDEVLRRYIPDVKIVVQEAIWTNPTRTCLLSLPAIPDDTHPVAFLDCDLAFEIPDLTHVFQSAAAQENFLEHTGTICTFHASNPNYSYAKLNEANEVMFLKEKVVISNHAIAGFYWFRRASIFKHYANVLMQKFPDREVFMSEVYNELLAEKHKINYLSLAYHLSFGTPDEYAAVVNREEWQRLKAKMAAGILA